MKMAKPCSQFWSEIERRYGEIPKFVKLVLRINLFDSFLALKGFRYDEKEFFASLEKTVKDFLNSDFENSEKLELKTELEAQYQCASSFCIKPGHRSCIMNLMLEIEKTETNEFFKKTADCSNTVTPLQPVSFKEEESFMLDTLEDPPKETPIIISRVEQGYSRDDEGHEIQVVEDYEYEEYLSHDESTNEYDDSIGIIRVDYDKVVSISTPKSTRADNSSPVATKRRPEHMYNEEFMARSVNPRRRRVGLNKTYPNTDEGTRERFRDLLFQSMECILPLERMPAIEASEIQVQKSEESGLAWVVYCPICNSRLRLPVVYENSGRYCNYKRSNFERHLRFKHCKGIN